MRKRKYIFQKPKRIFKRWSRTAWAVFASLNIVVHNCCTRILSFKDTLLKQQGASRAEIIRLTRETDPLEELEELRVPWLEELLCKLFILELLQTKVTVAAPKVVLPCSHISLSINVILLMGIFLFKNL